MKERKGILKVGGAPLTLVGEPAVVGQIAPDFTCVDAAMKEVTLAQFKGKRVVISVYPSIDTPVCAIQTARFNSEAAALGSDVVILSISKDLPFALGRFCAANGIESVVTLSDYRQSDFGLKYGFLIDQNKLLGRGVVVVDKMGKIVYVQYVDDLTHEPDYAAALSAVASC